MRSTRQALLMTAQAWSGRAALAHLGKPQVAAKAHAEEGRRQVPIAAVAQRAGQVVAISSVGLVVRAVWHAGGHAVFRQAELLCCAVAEHEPAHHASDTITMRFTARLLPF